MNLQTAGRSYTYEGFLVFFFHSCGQRFFTLPLSPPPAEPVTVGWGKKATQFHGSAGKQTALEKPLQDTGSAHPWDDLRPRVSWPEEGEYFACSCIDPASGLSFSLSLFQPMNSFGENCRRSENSCVDEGRRAVLY